MTLKGAIRSYAAAARRAERLQQQQNREAARRYKAQLKFEEQQNAVKVEADYRNYVNVLKTIHIDHSEPIDWTEVYNESSPLEPVKTTKYEDKAKYELESYNPSFFDKLFGLTKNKIEKLNYNLEIAKGADEAGHKASLVTYRKELDEWHQLKSISKGVLEKDINAYQEAIKFFKPFEDIIELNKRFRFNLNPDYIDVEFDSAASGIIPDFEANLTSTGKLSKKNMSASKFNELYLEHLSSCVVRVAKEISIYFPVSYIAVTVISNDTDRATGHNANSPILSILTTPNTINGLNLRTLNPSDAIRSFTHNLKFTKTNGLSTVPKIDVRHSILSS